MKKTVVSISEYRKKHSQKSTINKNTEYIEEPEIDEFVKELIFECNQKLNTTLNKK